MPIAIADKIIALLAGLSPEDVTALPPAERRRLADWCRRAADLAEPKKSVPPGILSDLRGGRES